MVSVPALLRSIDPTATVNAQANAIVMATRRQPATGVPAAACRPRTAAAVHQPTAAQASPAAKPTTVATAVLATSTSPRRGRARKVARTTPVPYSDVTTSIASATSASWPSWTAGPSASSTGMVSVAGRRCCEMS